MKKIRAKKMPSWLGFMFAGKKSIGKTIYFDLKKEKIVSLHMVFVFFPINVYLLNGRKEVVEIKNNLKPFHFYSFSKKAQYVIESPRELNLKIGDRVRFI
ncbi:MAG: DUF192 domain-containing protein [Candidatus Woesearchaeota archaeon]